MKNFSSSPKLLAAFVVTVGAALLPFAATHATEPTTKCITATSKAKNAAAIAQLEKDVAPYAKNAPSAEAIKAYRDALEVAWSALEQPYCGYGAEGSASAIKSFGKSVERSRAAFLASVKNHVAVKEVLEVAKHDSEETTTPDGPTPSIEKMMKTPLTTTDSPAPAKKAAATAKAMRIMSGLRRGMHADNIKDVQKLLATRYKISTDDLVTGYFGPKTEKFIIKFQLEKKIIKNEDDAGAGLIGPKTAAALNNL